MFSARLRVLYGEFAREFLPILTVLTTVFVAIFGIVYRYAVLSYVLRSIWRTS